MPAFFSKFTLSFSKQFTQRSSLHLSSWTCIFLSLIFLFAPAVVGQTNPECQIPPVPQQYGYYKDLLINRGVGLETGFNSTIANELGISFVEIAAIYDDDPDPATNQTQDIEQNLLLFGGIYDTNGILLYPDGQPRFRMVWVMGGQAQIHSDSFNADSFGNGGGQERFRAFFNEGGSYAGSCAGAFLADSSDNQFFRLWTGYMEATPHGLNDPEIPHSVQVEEDSPLIDLPGFCFTKDQVLGPITHAGGGALTNNQNLIPTNTEILLSYEQVGETAIYQYEGRAVSWAYKKDHLSGRMVNIGSHPEMAQSAAALKISKAIITYALAGQGLPEVKTTLPNGNPWCMNKRTEDQDPSHTRIGDKQYHHFQVNLDQASSIQIDLDEEAGWNSEAFDLHLYVASNELAFEQGTNLVASDLSSGITKTLITPQLPAGTYFIGVTCPNTVDYQSNSVVNPYNGSVTVLNGVAYRIRATWGSQQSGPYFTDLADSYCHNASSITLEGWPTGGTFQGPGVSGNTFSPAQLAPGTYTLSYTVGCTTVDQNVTIVAPPAPPLEPYRVLVRPANGVRCNLPVAGDGTYLVTDSNPAFTDYQWELMNPSSGSFYCHDGISVYFQFAPGATTAKVRVLGITDCGLSDPSTWVTINLNEL